MRSMWLAGALLVAGRGGSSAAVAAGGGFLTPASAPPPNVPRTGAAHRAAAERLAHGLLPVRRLRPRAGPRLVVQADESCGAANGCGAAPAAGGSEGRLCNFEACPMACPYTRERGV